MSPQPEVFDTLAPVTMACFNEIKRNTQKRQKYTQTMHVLFKVCANGILSWVVWLITTVFTSWDLTKIKYEMIEKIFWENVWILYNYIFSYIKIAQKIKEHQIPWLYAARIDADPLKAPNCVVEKTAPHWKYKAGEKLSSFEFSKRSYKMDKWVVYPNVPGIIN